MSSPRAGQVGWPTARQELLLHALTVPLEEMTEPWQRWRAPLDLDDIDSGSMRLMPYAARRLERLGLGDPTLDRIRGIYRQSWTRNQMLFGAAAPTLARLEQAGIETLLLKGAAVSVTAYHDTGVRWMADVDVLVRVEQAQRAHEILLGERWVPEDREPAPRTPEPAVIRTRHSCGYERPGALGLDLHWRALWQPYDDADFWAAAEPIELAGVATRALCPADQLLQICVHGVEWNPNGVHWLLDAANVIDAAGERLDWDRLIAQASARRVSRPIAAALGYMRDGVGFPIPERVIERLRGAPSSLRERIAFAALMRPPGPSRTLRVEWDIYRRHRENDVPGPAPRSFLGFLRDRSGFEGNADLAAHGARRVLSAPRRLVSGRSGD